QGDTPAPVRPLECGDRGFLRKTLGEPIGRLSRGRFAVDRETGAVGAGGGDRGHHRRGLLQSSPIERITRAGFPPTRVFGGTSLVTTEPAATTEFSPIVNPPTMVAPAAIQTFLSMTMGFPIVAA